jgi:hypothetical protein
MAPKLHEVLPREQVDAVTGETYEFQYHQAVGERRFQLLPTSTDEGVVPGGAGTRVWTPQFTVESEEGFLGPEPQPGAA